MTNTPELIINTAAIGRNYADLQSMSNGAEVAAVVKADAYGLGVEGVLPALMAAGCKTVFVATLAEALQVRSLDQSITIAVINGPQQGETETFAVASLTPVLNSLEQVARWQHEGSGDVYLHLDTGMNRLGLSARDIENATDDPTMLEGLSVALVMSHLACADEMDHPMNETQRNRFEHLKRQILAAPASLASSGGILMGAAYHYDMVRPGIALFGGFRQEEVVQARAPILQVRDALEGETVGYSPARRLKGNSRIATLAVGYADGVLRSMGDGQDPGTANVLIDGHTAAIIGRISMDLVTIDVSGIPEAAAHAGAMATLIGGGIGLDNVASSAGTISYEILTSLGNRYVRQYVNS